MLSASPPGRSGLYTYIPDDLRHFIKFYLVLKLWLWLVIHNWIFFNITILKV